MVAKWEKCLVVMMVDKMAASMAETLDLLLAAMMADTMVVQKVAMMAESTAEKKVVRKKAGVVS